jgi:hypothetical protein
MATMYLLLIERTLKTARDPGADRFGARTTTSRSWHVSGPFVRRASAERAAVLAMGTHSALSVQVVDLDASRAITESPQCHRADYGLLEALRTVLARLASAGSAV